MGETEVWQYSKLVKCPLENQYFASYIAIAAVYFERICIYKQSLGALRRAHFGNHCELRCVHCIDVEKEITEK